MARRVPNEQAATSVAFKDLDQWPHYSKYHQLDQTKKEIRILTILPGPRSNGIKCVLEQVPLASANPFFALSYSWGKAAETEGIVVNLERVDIRKNLWQFLWNLWQIKGTIRLWVDFLCINQRDITERNSQVKMMADIFGSANGVFAWLGAATPESEIAFDYIDRSRYLRHRQAKGTVIRRGQKAGKRAIRDLIDRSYWSRLWIIQEVVLAKDLWFLAGSRLTDWDALSSVAHPSQLVSRKREDDLPPNRLIFSSIWKVKRQNGDLGTLGELVKLFYRASCQDPRDRLYGLLALADPSTRAEFRIEYQNPVLQVFVGNYTLWSWALNTDQQHTLMPSSEILHDPYAFLSVMMPIYTFSFAELEQLRLDQDLRSKLTTKAIFEAELWCDLTKCYTFAAVNTSRSTIEYFGQHLKSLNRQFDAYITGVEINSSYSDFDQKTVVYTTKCPEEGDFFVTIKNTYLILRLSENGFRIVGTGVKAYRDRIYLSDPRRWTEIQIPDAKYCLVSDLLPNGQSDNQVLFHIRLNGPAIANLIINEEFSTFAWNKFPPVWNVWQFIREHGISVLSPEMRDEGLLGWGFRGALHIFQSDPRQRAEISAALHVKSISRNRISTPSLSDIPNLENAARNLKRKRNSTDATYETRQQVEDLDGKNSTSLNQATALMPENTSPWLRAFRSIGSYIDWTRGV